MTHEDLLKILDEQKIVRYRDYFIKAMKAAVNAALGEAAEKATMKKVGYFEAVDEEFNNAIEIWEDDGSSRPYELVIIDKSSITSLKIK